MAWPDVLIKDWNHFVNEIDPLTTRAPAQTPYLCRGQSNAEWGLRDSLTRSIQDGMPPEEARDFLPERALEIEGAALQQFIAQAHLFLDPATLPRDDAVTAWWAIMQHFGAPTRLLDWTKSPYVAAYFAVLEHPNRCGAVWLIHAGEVFEAFKRDYSSQFSIPPIPSESGRLYLKVDSPEMIHPFRLDKPIARMITQQGHFTVCGRILKNHDVLIEKVLGGNVVNAFRRLIIPPPLKPRLLNHLMAMNITAASLFPGLDGLGRSIREFVSVERFYRIPRI